MLIVPRREKVRIVQIVVVSSPGAGAVPHWSHEVAGDFARQAVARGAAVRWLVALHGGQPTPPGGPGLQVFAHKDRKVLAVNKVAGSQLRNTEHCWEHLIETRHVPRLVKRCI